MAESEIIITKDNVKIVDRSVTKIMTVSETLEVIKKLSGDPAKFFPIGLSFSYAAPQEGKMTDLYAITLPPGVYPFRYKGVAMMDPEIKKESKNNKVNSQLYYISLPFIHMLSFWQKGFRYAYMFATKKPLSSFNDDIFAVPIPNVNSDASVCFGGGLAIPEGSSIEKARYILDFYMDADHNDDYRLFLDAKLFKTFKEWQDESKKNPSIWDSFKLIPYSGFKTFGDLVKARGIRISG